MLFANELEKRRHILSLPLIEKLTEEVRAAFARRTRFVNMLLRRGLVVGYPEGIGRRCYEVALPDGSLMGVPLPITWSETEYTDLIEAQARRVGEMVERAALGVAPPVESTRTSVIGLVNCSHSSRIEYGPGEDLLEVSHRMVIANENRGFYGPYVLLHGRDLDHALDSYADDKGIMTKRHQILNIERESFTSVAHPIEEVQRIDWFAKPSMPPRTDFNEEDHSGTLVLVQMTPDVIQMIDVLSVRAVEWKDKVQVICVTSPWIKTNEQGHTGIVVARRRG